jgi:hypothetical protein
VRNFTLIDTDTQRATLRATSGTASREVRHPFRIGNSTLYTLPSSLGSVQWMNENGQLSASWATLPSLDQLHMSASRSGVDGSIVIQHDLAVTSAFLAAAGITRVAIDTEIPDYKPAWRIDFTGAYTRQLTATLTLEGATATSSVTEVVDASQTGGDTASRAARAAALR